MTRTEAPKDFEGRGDANLARTTPELPVSICQPIVEKCTLKNAVYHVAG